MTVSEVRRVLKFVLTLIVLQLTHGQSKGTYSVPEVTIEALKPKGFRASIPDAPNLTLFAFQGNINRAIGSSAVGALSGEALQATNGRWIVEDSNVKLKVGDVINYYVFVSVDRAGYLKDKLSYTVPELVDASSPVPAPGNTTPTIPVTITAVTTNPVEPSACRPTLTTVRGTNVCAGQVIFEDNFDNFRDDIWQIEQFIPIDQPDYPFVSYQRQAVSVLDGYLRITPSLQENSPGYDADLISSGTLNLYNGCTRGTCYMQTFGANILPPVVSGKVTSKGFSFTYGTVHIRAKLPQGDWLYPEMFLEPLLKKYGSTMSGTLKIACARGNKMLYIGPSDYGNKLLYGGPIIDANCQEPLLNSRFSADGSNWGDDFHEYSVRWSPDRFIFLVDGEEWARVEPAASGLVGRLPQVCRKVSPTPVPSTSSIAPFDDNFYITLGVAAGGISEFRDGLFTSDGRPKPWTNRGRKASLNFWQDKDAWYRTWSQPALLIDYVKVVAL